mmetsp:Transcript_44181/g.58649  ORF Transcript_44181/g.58649 Transcript_44181/m.58649 type:complete len:96 (+) Transcript_44181:598-885(+)
MRDPVILTSGMTFERHIVEQFIRLEKEKLERFKGDDEFDPASLFRCPITSKVFNPDRIIPNKRIKRACTDFRLKNFWAFEYDPREDYDSISVWNY